MILLLPLFVGAVTFACVAWLGDRRAAAAAGNRISVYLAPRAVPRPDQQVLMSRYERTLVLSERQLERVRWWHRFAALVERAGTPMRPVVLLWAVVSGLALIVLLAVARGLSPLLTAMLLGLAVVGVRAWLGSRVSARRDAFEEQLPELLSSLSSAMRAGHGLTQALQAVAADMPDPVAGELGRVLAEARLGRSLEDALVDLGARIGSRELDFVLDAIVVQRQVGGSLAGIFEIVGDSVRQRQQFALKIRSLTAMGRASALVLVALPVVLAGGLSLRNHAYMAPLLDQPTGRVMLIAALVLMLFGCFWLKRIVGYRGEV